jgi:hypothetical protein
LVRGRQKRGEEVEKFKSRRVREFRNAEVKEAPDSGVGLEEKSLPQR